MVKCSKCGIEIDEEKFEWCTKCWAPINPRRSSNADEAHRVAGCDYESADDVRLMLLEELRSVNDRVRVIEWVAVLFGLLNVIGVAVLLVNLVRW